MNENINATDRRVALRMIAECPCEYQGTGRDYNMNRMQVLWMNRANMRVVIQILHMN